MKYKYCSRMLETYIQKHSLDSYDQDFKPCMQAVCRTSIPCIWNWGFIAQDHAALYFKHIVVLGSPKSKLSISFSMA